MSTTTTIEPKKESLGISAALILSLVGLTLLLVIAVLIKREIRRGNVKSKRDGHFWSCKFFQKVYFSIVLNRSFSLLSSVYTIESTERWESLSKD
jgi:hypothetical protein